MVPPRLIFVAVLALLVLSAADGTSMADVGACSRAPQRGKIISATVDTERSVTRDQAIGQIAHAFGNRLGPLVLLLTISALEITYDTQRIEVVYETVDPFGCPTIASGIVGIPLGMNSTTPMVVYHHGTKYNRFYRSTPHHPDTESELVITVFAASGHVIVLPDYLGFEASDMLHPYVHASTLGSASTDLMMAARTLLASNGIVHNGQLFLTGYSEGGYAAMATLREVQRRRMELGVQVTAASPMAGPHDISNVFFSLFASPNATYSSPVYLVFTIAAYRFVYPNDVPPLDQVFVAEYMDDIADGLSGNRSTFARLNAKLSERVSDLFTPQFARAISSPSNPLRRRLAENDMDTQPIVPAWLPIVFRHCPDDELVPFEASSVAVDNLRALGATDISLEVGPAD
eukprot:Opistho-2@70351